VRRLARVDAGARVGDAGGEELAAEVELEALEVRLAHHERVVDVRVDQPAAVLVEAQVVLDRGMRGREARGEALEARASERVLRGAGLPARDEQVEVR
jgi:hypothetical protein